MISKCANPACSVPFQYLRDGKLFRMEFRPPAHGPKMMGSAKSAKIEHYWLCGPCSSSYTMVMRGGQAKAVPLQPALFKAAAAS